MILIECVISETGGRVHLPYEQAHKLAALGRVKLPEPKADNRFRKPGALPLAQTWQDGRFWPVGYTAR
jgi:hypothetical protein